MGWYFGQARNSLGAGQACDEEHDGSERNDSFSCPYRPKLPGPHRG